MADPRVTGLRSIEFNVPDVTTTAKFYEKCWGLAPVTQTAGAHYLRATGAEHHIVVLHEGDKAGMRQVNFGASNKATVNALHTKLQGLGAPVTVDPAPLSGPGGGYGFSFTDPDGMSYGISTDVAQHKDATMVEDRPFKLSHVVLNSDATDDTIGFFTGVLGFTLVDQTKMLNFLRCNSDHHTIAFANGGGAGLHHVAYELPDIESLMLGVGRMRDSGWNVDWGVGRHGPGNNVFSYFVGPDDMVIEYTAEVMQVDESNQPGGPDDWGFLPGRTDQWGVTDPPSDRLKAVHGKVGFADSLDIPA